MKIFVWIVFVFFKLVNQAESLSRNDHLRNRNVDTLRDNLLQTKCRRHLVQDDEMQVSTNRVFNHLQLSIAEKGCLQETFGKSSIALVEMIRLHDWVNVMEDITEQFGAPSCFQNSSASSPKFQVCLSHNVDKHFLQLSVDYYLQQVMHRTLADFRHKSFCKESRTNLGRLSCYVNLFKCTCSITTRTRYTTIHSNPAMEVCTVFKSEMIQNVVSFRKS